MATVSFNMQREIKNDKDADYFIEALEKSKCIVAEKEDTYSLKKDEEESRAFLRKTLCH